MIRFQLPSAARSVAGHPARGRFRADGCGKCRGPRRRGSILLAVLVLVALLALGAYTFTEWMLAEAEATSMYQRGVQARLFAESGIEYAALIAGDPSMRLENLDDNPALFQGILMRDGPTPRGRGYFSLVVPGIGSTGAIRYGLADESGKLNLNAMMQWGLTESQQQTMLSYIPGMTPEIIDAILDWIDSDSTPRTYGAEADYGISPPYLPANGPLTSLDDLLNIPGVTPELLYGEDSNANGLLDPNENDGPASMPIDNADGRLDAGWASYLTIYSREANRTPEGTPKINVNQSDLVMLYDQLEPIFGMEVARFIAAYRLFGPIQNGQAAGGSAGGPNQNGGRGDGEDEDEDEEQGDDEGRGGDDEEDEEEDRGGGGGGGQQSSQTSQDTMRAGMDLSSGGQVQVNSLYELVGVQVQLDQNNGNTTLSSPWPNDPSGLQQYLPDLLGQLTTNDQEFIAGRIRVDTAPAEILMGLPDMPVAAVDAIVARSLSGNMASSSTTGTVPTTGWLLAEGILTLEQMRQFDLYLTARGDVFSVQAIGYYEQGGPTVRLEAIVDAVSSPAGIVAVRDMTALGRGYAPEQLQPAAAIGL